MRDAKQANHLKLVGVSSKHLRVFLERLRQSSEIFGNSRKCSRTFVWPSKQFWKILENLQKWLEIFGKSSKTSSSVCLYNKKNTTRKLEDTNSMFSWEEQYSCHSNIKFISSRHRVISSTYSSPFTGILRTHKVASSSWIDSVVGRALHHYHRGHGFESRSGLNLASPCNINNFDGMENSGGWLGSFEGQKSVRTFHVCYKNPISVLYDYLWPPSLACSFPNRVCYWLSKQKINQLNNAPSAWNNRSYRIREQIKIQIWKRYRTTLGFLVLK